MSRTCVGCRFFNDLPHDRRRQNLVEMEDGSIRQLPDRPVGECRADPPKLLRTQSTWESVDTGVWPFVLGSAWCGRFAPATTNDAVPNSTGKRP